MLMNDADAPHFIPHRRRRSGFAARVLLIALVGLLASACAGSASFVGAERVADATADVATADPTETLAAREAIEPPTSSTSDPSPTPGDNPPVTPTAIAAVDTELPPAPIGFESLVEREPRGPLPVAIAIENIDIDDAAIIPVGVNEDDLSFEVPPADQVGWYEFGPTPGQPGSAVLAAHIAYNGQDGVFRNLEAVEVGSIVVVTFDDGGRQRYRIEEVTEYVKEELPGSLFARDGDQQLALITCGGAFNDQLDSYDSNTVAIAVPVG